MNAGEKTPIQKYWNNGKKKFEIFVSLKDAQIHYSEAFAFWKHSINFNAYFFSSLCKSYKFQDDIKSIFSEYLSKSSGKTTWQILNFFFLMIQKWVPKKPCNGHFLK